MLGQAKTLIQKHLLGCPKSARLWKCEPHENTAEMAALFVFFVQPLKCAARGLLHHNVFEMHYFLLATHEICVSRGSWWPRPCGFCEGFWWCLLIACMQKQLNNSECAQNRDRPPGKDCCVLKCAQRHNIDAIQTYIIFKGSTVIRCIEG